jgi:uncharacterized membrane protein
LSSGERANGRAPLRLVALGCHALLGVTLAAAVVTANATPARALAGMLILAPLLVTLPGLAHGRRTVEQWLAVLLVLYAGATSVEVIARAGAPLVSTALLAAVTELGVVLALIRRSQGRSPSVHE